MHSNRRRGMYSLDAATQASSYESEKVLKDLLTEIDRDIGKEVAAMD
jgi:hypothetical protein